MKAMFQKLVVITDGSVLQGVSPGGSFAYCVDYFVAQGPSDGNGQFENWKEVKLSFNLIDAEEAGLKRSDTKKNLSVCACFRTLKALHTLFCETRDVISVGDWGKNWPSESFPSTLLSINEISFVVDADVVKLMHHSTDGIPAYLLKTVNELSSALNKADLQRKDLGLVPINLISNI